MSSSTAQDTATSRPLMGTPLDLDLETILFGQRAHLRGHEEFARGRPGPGITWFRIADLLENAEAQHHLVVLECDGEVAPAACAPVLAAAGESQRKGARRRRRTSSLAHALRSATGRLRDRLGGQPRRLGLAVWLTGCLAGIAVTATVGLSIRQHEPVTEAGSNLDLLAPLPKSQASSVPVKPLNGRPGASPTPDGRPSGIGPLIADLGEPTGFATSVPALPWTKNPDPLAYLSSADRQRSDGKWEIFFEAEPHTTFVATLSSASDASCTWRFVGRSRGGAVAETPLITVPAGDRRSITVAVGDWRSMSALITGNTPRACLLVAPDFIPNGADSASPSPSASATPAASPSPTPEATSQPSPTVNPDSAPSGSPSPAPGRHGGG